MMTGQYSVLTQLVLSQNSLKDFKANGLIELLRAEECSLTALDVSDNPLNGAMVLRSLKFNASLTYLNVCGTEVLMRNAIKRVCRSPPPPITLPLSG